MRREGGELDVGGGGQWCKMPRKGEGPKVVSYSRVGSLEPLIRKDN